jgi:hypothetical protein
MFLAVAI